MTRRQELKLFAAIGVFASLFFVCAFSFAQTRAIPPKTIFIDAEGKFISNNEFVDIRMANFNYPDATIVKNLPDGNKEFQLQKIQKKQHKY